jgi:DNA-binding NtrC family response regulator
MKPEILFVDDDESLRKVLTRELAHVGFEVRAFASAEGVVDSVRERPPAAALLDLKLPGIGGLELLQRLRAVDEHLQAVVLTGHGAVADAVEAMKLGAHDFLTKPVQLDVLEQALRRALEKRGLLEDVERLKRAAEPSPARSRLSGDSPAMARLRRDVERVAASMSNVLIQGENGAGKELTAREIHSLGPRSAAPFVVVNCGAIPVTLIESELFGHERGAFSGAERRRLGLFEAAHGGTLLLDEIGELPKSVQPALLRALQFGEVRPVGSERTKAVDVRVIAATHRDLSHAIASGEFREDLYYRISTLVIEVPPLRARREDIAPLAQSFLARACARAGRRLTLTPTALKSLEDHAWPGNVRELENVVERLAVLGEGDAVDALELERFLLRRGGVARGELPSLNLETLERLAVTAAMKRFDGDKKAAAAELGVALKTLYNMLDRYGMRGAGAAAHEHP